MALKSLADLIARAAIVRFADLLGVHREASRTRVVKAKAGGVTFDGVSLNRDVRLLELETGNRELRLASTFPRQASECLCCGRRPSTGMMV